MLLDGARSAEPPINVGSLSAIALRTCPEAARVAIGLALASASRFSQFGEEGKALGALVINVITATTFIVQIIGPIFVKFAITRAGEVGMAKKKNDVWASEGTPK